MLFRIIGSIGAMMAYSFFNMLYAPIAMLGSGQASVHQLERSDNAYLHATYGMAGYSGGFIIMTAVLFVVLAFIWYAPIKKLIHWLTETSTLPVILMLGIAAGMYHSTPAMAYYDQKDFTEAYSILPNETAIMVPVVGDNASSQGQMDSEAYLKSKQVAAKMVTIPHSKLSGTGSFYDFYVPSAKLFIVDRTTFSHEWVKKGRGSAASVDESFPCQSSEGLDIGVGVSIGATVAEGNAAKYLYNFGVTPLAANVDRTQAAVIFQSVYYSRKVADVMNDVGRKKVQGLVCAEISSRTFQAVNTEANKIMEAVQTKATAYFDSVGITLSFIGWADTFTFSDGVQKAVDDKFIALTLQPLLPIMTTIANLKVQEGLGKGLELHGLPIVVTPDMMNVLAGLASKVPAPVTSAPAAPVPAPK